MSRANKITPACKNIHLAHCARCPVLQWLTLALRANALYSVPHGDVHVQLLDACMRAARLSSLRGIVHTMPKDTKRCYASPTLAAKRNVWRSCSSQLMTRRALLDHATELHSSHLEFFNR